MGGPVAGLELDSDRYTARRVLELCRAGKVHRESVDAAREEVWRRGIRPPPSRSSSASRTGEPVRLIYDVQVSWSPPLDRPSRMPAGA
jgi:hypothetical protein